MKSDPVNVQHRPFMTPVWLFGTAGFLAVAVAIFAVWMWGTANATTVIVIRHAEKEKLTLVNASGGSRILPAYLSDNYFSLLPGETREIDIEYPAGAAQGAPQIALRGWNLVRQSITVVSQK